MKNYPYFGKVDTKDEPELVRYINFKLAAMGKPYIGYDGAAGCSGDERDAADWSDETDETDEGSGIKSVSAAGFIKIAQNLIQNYNERNRLLKNYLCAVDRRINSFLKRYFSDIGEDVSNIPTGTFVLDRYGLARQLSIPPGKNEFSNKYVESYRIKQGVLHNPRSDKRTTEGTFHIAEGSFPVPIDKKEVPKIAFSRLLKAAVNPPEELLLLPFTAGQKEQAKIFVSAYLKPLVQPEVPGIMSEKRMEIRYFAPGSLVSNLDFVESIFGNAGDPGLVENDSALDVERWSGHTGCIILAPHLTTLTKKGLGLPHREKATERQVRDRMFWEKDDELYNEGRAFKITCRSEEGVVITLIADNYFGYSKKEVKTQISFAANLLGLAEEEHAGGALVYPRKSLGEHYFCDIDTHSFEDVIKLYGQFMEIRKDENYGIDKKYPSILYLPENAEFSLYRQEITWDFRGKEIKIKLLPGKTYVLPDGSKVHMEKHPEAPVWRLVGTAAEGTLCHKPFTVSGGGKSEISKSLLNSVIYDSFYVNNFTEDFNFVEKLFNYDYSRRWKDDDERTRPSRPFLSPKRSLGSVIKLLNHSSHYTDEYNAFLDSIPNRIKALAFYIKRFYRPDWGDNWKEHFSVRVINGKEGNALYFDGRKVVASFLRVGFAPDDSWYIHKLRTDFMASAKLQQEDDITVSITLDSSLFERMPKKFRNRSLKILKNCEYRLFQRPDEAIHRGYDIEAEADLAGENNFISNYQPLNRDDAKELIENSIAFDEYTDPIKKIIMEGSKSREGTWFITPSHPRVVDGEVSTNPRYLQTRPDITRPIDYYLGETGTRLFRKIPAERPVLTPVDAVLPSRRNNRPDKKRGIKGLSVYNPIHYQELPELFMDFICSLSGKSPSTTGAGSEGALTKGPFNMLSGVTDLNNALLSFILTGYSGYTSVAGWIGSYTRFDHDISILIPEIWSRLSHEERDPEKLIEEGSLEKIDDFEWKGEKVLTSRLGYRITDTFLFNYMGRIFDEPFAVFGRDVLRPERQDIDAFIDGVNYIVESQRKVALMYFEDKSVNAAIPPLKALLHIMAYGHYEGMDVNDPSVREMFKREYVLSSDWYKERLELKQRKEISHWERLAGYIKKFMAAEENVLLAEKLKLSERLEICGKNLGFARSENYIKQITGTVGADPLFR